MKFLIGAVKRLYVIVSIYALTLAVVNAGELPVHMFPIEHYKQDVDAWINPADPNYDQPLLNAEQQEKHLAKFLDHYMGDHSPWNADFVNKHISLPVPDDIRSAQRQLVSLFSNSGKTGNDIGYAENFRPFDNKWIKAIEENMNIAQFSRLHYQAGNRAISVKNLAVRALPTNDKHFYSYKVAGQGYPFDNLQMSALWAGTPVYIIGESKDHAWSLVLTQSFEGWVKSDGLARVTNSFVSDWQKYAKSKLAAITQTKTGISNNNGKFLFSAYVGMVFPAIKQGNSIALMVPVANSHGYAKIQIASVAKDKYAIMPLEATPHNFARIMKTLIGRPYGWGGMDFYNDCSQEMKSLFTPFGVWLPRHSSHQVRVGRFVDKSYLSKNKRIAYLKKNGHPFMTLLYIGGHVVLYIGNYSNPKQPATKMAMTYQDVWGFKPRNEHSRYVIGGSVLLPMLAKYPENKQLKSQAEKQYFQLGYLDD